MKFGIRLSIIFLVISLHNNLITVHGKGYTFSLDQDCPSPLSESELTPNVVIESSSGFNSRRPSVFNSTDFVDAVGFSRAYFDCRHSTPVQWILDIHPISRDAFQFTRSFSQRVSNSSFSAYVEFLYKPGDQGDLKHRILFICASVCGGHTFLEITPGKYSALIQPTSSPTTATFLSLANILLNPQPSDQDKDALSSCEMILHVQVTYDTEGQHHLFYAWSTSWNEGILLEKELLVKPSQTTMDQGIYFRNVFRTVISGQRGHCVKVLKETDLCSKCVEVLPEEGQLLNSVAFFARSNTLVKMAFKGIFTTTRPRRLYFDCELENSTALQDLMDFQPPPVLYVGHEIDINCSVSNNYFAYGTLIYRSKDIGVNTSQSNMSQFAPFSSNLGEKEIWLPDGRRIVNKGIVFPTGNQTETLTCSAPLWDWSKRVEKTVQVFVDFPVPPEIEGSSRPAPELHIVETGQENVTLTCSAIGKPRPILEWRFPFSSQDVNVSDWIDILSKDGVDADQDNPDRTSSTILVTKIHPKLLGTYLCSAFNTFGNASKSFILEVPEEGLPFTTKVTLSSSLGLLALLGLLTVGFIYRKIILQRREYATKTAEAIREFKEGAKRAQLEKEKMAVFFSSSSAINKITLDKMGDLVEDEEGGAANNCLHPHQSILELPYDSQFEVDLIKWIIEEACIGSGTFGVVRKGTVEIGDKRQTVAVKVLKSTVEIEDFKSFLTELKIMAYIGKHPNIVSLVAACTQNIEQRDVMIGVEFCANGSLQDYLQEKRSMFQTGSLEARNSTALKTYSNLNNPVALTELDLFTWSYQIANGMEFLSNKNVLHGDLATRNVLLTMDKTAKISDFGLSRILLEANKNYTKKSRVPLPWKWMALESLKSLQFSSASDVWAFGVTIFEIFSLGEVPYAGLSFGPEFILQLENGFRLARPPLATEYVYNIMKHCWNPAVEFRTTFPQLKTAFSELLDVFTNPGGAPVPPMGRRRLNTPNSVFQNSPVAQPRRLANQPQQENWYSNRPLQIPNLYLNV